MHTKNHNHTTKKRLYNRYSRKELRQALQQDNIARCTISFYKYFVINDPLSLRDEMFIKLSECGVLGRIYIAKEGINAQISVPKDNLSALRDYLNTIEQLRDVRLNLAVAEGKSFWLLKIKVRDKIVADGINDPNFSLNKVGDYVNAAEFNQLANDANTVVVDMRNHYEYEVGHFTNAVLIPSDTFKDQLPMAVDMLQEHKDKNIVMYCTGGIRCEKASAWMLHNGFKKVYHLEGGIINYVKEVKEQGLDNKFKGVNFVFDNRLSEAITNDVISHCHICQEPANRHTNCANDGCHLLFIQCEACKAKLDNCCSEHCQQIIKLPEDEQRTLRRGNCKPSKIFNKSLGRLLQFSS